MAVLRSSQLIVLRNLPRGSRQIRRLAYYRQITTVVEQTDRPSTQQSESSNSIRHFHRSRHLRAPNDSSTIDFAYLPETMEPEEPEVFRVPILPNNYSNTTNAAAEEEEAVMKPEISTMSADAIFLPMADLSDGHAMNIDFHAMADRVAVNLRQMKVPVEEQASMMKQIWADLVDDMLGLRKKDAGVGKG